MTTVDLPTPRIREVQETSIPAREAVKFYQVGSYAVGNRLVDENDRGLQSEPDRINSLTSGHRACQGCGEALGARYAVDAATEAAGRDIVAVNATGCLEVFSTPYPETSWTIPWIHSLFGNAPAVASGAAAALKALGKKTRVIAQGGDGGTVDIGMGCLSGMFERNDDVLYICYDNGAYMNTGVQRSGATPPTARTATTQPIGPKPGNVFGQGKDTPRIAMAHDVPYVATATVADLRDLEYKVRKAMTFTGCRYIHVLVPCPLGWGSASNLTVRLARLATQTGLFPVYEAEAGEITSVTKLRRPVPVTEYLRPQRRFAHLFKPGQEAELERMQEIADRNIRRYGLLDESSLDEDVLDRILAVTDDPEGRFRSLRVAVKAASETVRTQAELKKDRTVEVAETSASAMRTPVSSRNAFKEVESGGAQTAELDFSKNQVGDTDRNTGAGADSADARTEAPPSDTDTARNGAKAVAEAEGQK